MRLPDQIRSAAAWVSEQAAEVRVNQAAIPAYAAALPEAAAEDPLDPAAHVTEGSAELRAAFFLTLDAINFGSGWWPTLRKRDGLSGYFTVATGLRERFAHRGAWSAAELANLEPAEVAAALGQDPGHELIGLFAESLNDLGRRLEHDHGGRFLSPVEAAGNSAVSLAEELAGWACFADRSTYRGREVPLYKRAQIAPADLAAAGVAEFTDLDRLTLFADNLIPHVLRLDGVLEFGSSLVEQIEAGRLLEHGSPAEVEMRCGAIQVAELICAERPDLDPRQVDRLLWARGGGRRYKAVPRPRVRCTAY